MKVTLKKSELVEFAGQVRCMRQAQKNYAESGRYFWKEEAEKWESIIDQVLDEI